MPEIKYDLQSDFRGLGEHHALTKGNQAVFLYSLMGWCCIFGFLIQSWLSFSLIRRDSSHASLTCTVEFTTSLDFPIFLSSQHCLFHCSGLTLSAPMTDFREGYTVPCLHQTCLCPVDCTSQSDLLHVSPATVSILF